MRKLVALVLVASSCSLVGCAGMFESACTKAVPVITQGTLAIDDAQDALLQAEAIVAAFNDLKLREQAMKGINDARAELRRSAALLKVATSACSAPDLKSIFKAFAEAWSIVRPFLGTTGGAGSQFDDPIAYKLGYHE